MSEIRVPQIFADLRVSIVPNEIPESELTDLEVLLETYGADTVPYGTGPAELKDLLKCTHIVSGSIDFPEYYAALDRVKAVVTPKWVKDGIRKTKLLPVRPYSPDPALVLRDVVVYFTGLPPGDVEVLTGGLNALGGVLSNGKSKLVTHVVALDITPSLAKTIEDGRLKAKVVLPHWLNDCLKLARRLNERPYQLPDPAILNLNPPRVKPTSSANIRGASSPCPSELLSPGNTPRRLRSSTALDGQFVCFSHEGVSDEHRKLREELVEAAGGRLVDEVKRATIYVSLYRDGKGYVEAYQRKIVIGNLAWLDFVISHAKFNLPTRRLMHYPVPRSGIRGFKGTKICITNYTGEARIYLENLILSCGGDYTKTFSKDNTHLIAANESGEKVEAARSWEIPIVNHLWLEDCYAQCECLSLTHAKYVYFPHLTNLGETVGQIQMNRAALGEQVQGLAKKYGITLKSGRSKPVAAADGTPDPDSDLTDEDDDVLDHDTPSSPSKTASSRTLSSRTVNATPSGQPSSKTPRTLVIGQDKENETPPTTGGRGAKSRALSKVHDMATDMNLFDREMKRKGGVLHGRDRRSDASIVTDDTEDKPPKSKKRRSSEFDTSTEVDEEISVKKQKVVKAVKTLKSPVMHRMMVTMYQPWQNNARKESNDKNKLRNLGIFITEKPTEVTILCAPAIVRTKKFVTALAGAPKVVSTDFIDDALENKELPDPDGFALEDQEGEQRWNFNLVETLERADLNCRQLLKGVQIFCTPKVKGGWEGYNEIAVANGGSCRLYEGKEKFHVRVPGSQKSKKSSRDSLTAAQHDPVFLVSSTQPADRALWEHFRKMAQNADMEPRICSENWLLHAAMTQEMEWGGDSVDLTV
ncbi:BRCT domain-containing protein [Eremomyces bilateralis CBS 781.70]|uniref:BRCT domain-containing protein n=1 Tax=Eremomyces bilateralis CBS 781.70 TaxID=1392243 RepID=A0A6G1GFY1_9PEZI|nr:BRCT domain-containing protein [Eremomyces bilateralis CBS 781.70]KAF1816934.1 BRCT domain-containing protein [Eremomyces bilateralis CBS 781.70]